jgi:hypothetical protein
MTGEQDPHGYIGGVNALIFVFALSLVGIGSGVAIWGAIIWNVPALWFLAVIMLSLGCYILYDGLRKH